MTTVSSVGTNGTTAATFCQISVLGKARNVISTVGAAGVEDVGNLYRLQQRVDGVDNARRLATKIHKRGFGQIGQQVRHHAGGTQA